MSEGVVDAWSLLKINWCDYHIQHIGGGGLLIPYGHRHLSIFKLVVWPHCTWVDTGDDDDDDDDDGDDDDDDDDCKCGATSGWDRT